MLTSPSHVNIYYDPTALQIPIFTTVSSFRAWRTATFDEKKSVGPHEDLLACPRTLARDLQLLEAQHVSIPHADSRSRPITPSAVFLPSVPEMYPSGISQDCSSQRGTFVENKKGFFTEVATVVTRLFNVIQPSNAYFGQTDIQQALLLFAYPTPSAHSPALSSRNAYLTADEHEIAGATLYKALCAGQHAWSNGESKDACIRKAHMVIEDVAGGKEAIEKGVNISLDHIEINNGDTFEVLGPEVTGIVEGRQREAIVLSGAI
ncbi:hypothetical protein PILCRDRAFT_94993 [Piloderma croceum F 1598]|uniref:Pantoate--beta-alanine ligase n=1 Tax=Piloderma croceum (strain F 1598) TaxID=765440 RepID=A0A0C3GGW1_PILCF|nr:hypothetical protein PILCRDRAFT_94993 [Piloderma croceum F 1598]